MSKKIESVEVSKFSSVVSALLAGEKVSLAGLSAGEKFFIAELSHEGKRAEFARSHLLRDTLEESRKELSQYMKGIRESLGSPKSDTELYKISERIRKALSIALDREFPSDKKKRQARTPGKVAGKVAGKIETTAAKKTAADNALTQLEGNLIGVMDNAFALVGGNKADLLQFAVMTLKQWSAK